jgi:hypothetical protein
MLNQKHFMQTLKTTLLLTIASLGATLSFSQGKSGLTARTNTHTTHSATLKAANATSKHVRLPGESHGTTVRVNARANGRAHANANANNHAKVNANVNSVFGNDETQVSTNENADVKGHSKKAKKQHLKKEAHIKKDIEAKEEAKINKEEGILKAKEASNEKVSTGINTSAAAKSKNK